MLPQFKRTTLSSEPESVSTRSKFSSSIDIRFAISIFILFVSLFGLLVLFGIGYYYDLSSEKRSTQINRVVDVINLDSVNTLLNFDRKVFVLQSSDKNRAGYQTIINELSTVVIPGVRLTSVDISNNDSSHYTVTLEATAASLVIYLQHVIALNELGGLFQGISLVDYNINRETNSVTFSLKKEFSVDQVNQIST